MWIDPIWHALQRNQFFLRLPALLPREDARVEELTWQQKKLIADLEQAMHGSSWSLGRRIEQVLLEAKQRLAAPAETQAAEEPAPVVAKTAPTAPPPVKGTMI